MDKFNAVISSGFRADPYPAPARLRDPHGVVRLNPGLIERRHVLRNHGVQAVLAAATAVCPAIPRRNIRPAAAARISAPECRWHG